MLIFYLCSFYFRGFKRCRELRTPAGFATKTRQRAQLLPAFER
jgi:hypothetical protein